MDSGGARNVLSKEFVCRLGIEHDPTKRRIMAVTGQKSPVVRILRDVVIHLAEKFVKLSLLLIEGSQYEVIVGDPTMEGIRGALDLGNRVASAVVQGEKVDVPMYLYYVHEDPGYKYRADAEDFT